MRRRILGCKPGFCAVSLLLTGMVSGCGFVSSHLSSESPAVSSESVELKGKTSYNRLIRTKENFISVRSTYTLKI